VKGNLANPCIFVVPTHDHAPTCLRTTRSIGGGKPTRSVNPENESSRRDILCGLPLALDAQTGAYSTGGHPDTPSAK